MEDIFLDALEGGDAVDHAFLDAANQWPPWAKELGSLQAEELDALQRAEKTTAIRHTEADFWNETEGI